jgi:hypothetical protein
MAMLVAAGVMLLFGLEVGYSLAIAPYEIRTVPVRGAAPERTFFKGPISAAIFHRS